MVGFFRSRAAPFLFPAISDRGALLRLRRLRGVELPVAQFDAASSLVPGKRKNLIAQARRAALATRRSRAMKSVKHGRYVLIPAGPNTHGHFSHFYASLWKPYLIEFMATLGPAPAAAEKGPG